MIETIFKVLSIISIFIPSHTFIQQENTSYQIQIKQMESYIEKQDEENRKLWEFIEMTEDYNDLVKIVEAEAGGESLEGKKHVASVIFNRVDESKFPNSIHEVIFQKGQFSPIADGRFTKIQVSEDSILATNEIIENGSISDALYFMNPKSATSKNKDWMQSLNQVAIVGNHEFYK